MPKEGQRCRIRSGEGSDDLLHAGLGIALLELGHPGADHVAGHRPGHEDHEVVDLRDAGTAEGQIGDIKLDKLVLLHVLHRTEDYNGRPRQPRHGQCIASRSRHSRSQASVLPRRSGFPIVERCSGAANARQPVAGPRPPIRRPTASSPPRCPHPEAALAIRFVAEAGKQMLEASPSVSEVLDRLAGILLPVVGLQGAMIDANLSTLTLSYWEPGMDFPVTTMRDVEPPNHGWRGWPRPSRSSTKWSGRRLELPAAYEQLAGSGARSGDAPSVGPARRSLSRSSDGCSSSTASTW